MIKRCAWAESSPLMTRYHDTEWGRPVHDDRLLFEMLTLEGAQAGLSWSASRSEEHTSELQSLTNLVCRLLLEKKKNSSNGTADVTQSWHPRSNLAPASTPSPHEI